MDPLLEQGGLTAALVAMVLAVTKLVQGLAVKKNGSDIPAKLAVLEAKMHTLNCDLKEIKNTTDEINDNFFQFREEVRLYWARETVLREVKKNESAG